MEERPVSVTKYAKAFMDIENKQNFGSKIHKYIENYLTTRINPIVNSEEEKKVFLHFKEFLKDHPHYEFIEAEKDISYKYKGKRIVGKIDALFRNVNNPHEYIIIDWKIMKDLDYDKNKKYWYIINLYAKILQKEMPDNIRIKMFLVLLHQNKLSYIIKPCYESKYSLTELLEIANIK